MLDEQIEEYFPVNSVYEKVKEKLIGITIKYEADFDEIFESLVDKYAKSSQDFIKSKKDVILKIFTENNHSNIRTLIFSLTSIDKIYGVLNKIDYGAKIANMVKYTGKTIIIKFLVNMILGINLLMISYCIISMMRKILLILL